MVLLHWCQWVGKWASLILFGYGQVSQSWTSVEASLSHMPNCRINRSVLGWFLHRVSHVSSWIILHFFNPRLSYSLHAYRPLLFLAFIKVFRWCRYGCSLSFSFEAGWLIASVSSVIAHCSQNSMLLSLLDSNHPLPLALVLWSEVLVHRYLKCALVPDLTAEDSFSRYVDFPLWLTAANHIVFIWVLDLKRPVEHALGWSPRVVLVIVERAAQCV